MGMIAGFRTPKNRDQFARVLTLLINDALGDFVNAEVGEDGQVELMFRDNVGDGLDDVTLVPMDHLVQMKFEKWCEAESLAEVASEDDDDDDGPEIDFSVN
jgi:hypothetical protein